jgi:ABC-type uncharacterized transport system permease subunit
MLSGVSITCFSASYAVCLLLEAAAFFRRSGLSRAVMLAFAASGLLAHTVYLGHRALHPLGAPLSSQQDWYLVSAWILVATYLYVSCYHGRTAMGLLVLPLVFALIGAAAWFADRAPFEHEPAIQAWGLVHGVALLLATVAVLIGFLCGLMYLWQAFSLKRKLSPCGDRGLPSLEWLHRNTVRAVCVAAPLMGVGVGAGIVLNLIHQPNRLPLGDPLTLASLGAFGWLTLAGVLSYWYEPVRHGRRVALLTVMSFLVLTLTLGVGLFAGTRHRQRQAMLMSRHVQPPSVMAGHIPSVFQSHRPASPARPLVDLQSGYQPLLVERENRR